MYSLHVVVQVAVQSVLTSIARLVHVHDLNLTTQILVPPCQTWSVYAIKEFGYPPKIFRHLWIFLWVLKFFFLIYTILPPPKVIGFLFIYNDFRCPIHIMLRDPMEICDECTLVWEISFTRWRLREHLQKACNFTKVSIAALPPHIPIVFMTWIVGPSKGVIYDVCQKSLNLGISSVGSKTDFQCPSKYNSHVAAMSYLSYR